MHIYMCAVREVVDQSQTCDLQQLGSSSSLTDDFRPVLEVSVLSPSALFRRLLQLLGWRTWDKNTLTTSVVLFLSMNIKWRAPWSVQSTLAGGNKCWVRIAVSECSVWQLNQRQVWQQKQCKVRVWVKQFCSVTACFRVGVTTSNSLLLEDGVTGVAFWVLTVITRK